MSCLMGQSSSERKQTVRHQFDIANSGDVEAINKVLKHYEGYIAALATKGFPVRKQQGENSRILPKNLVRIGKPFRFLLPVFIRTHMIMLSKLPAKIAGT